jgi:hypothetical protein
MAYTLYRTYVWKSGSLRALSLRSPLPFGRAMLGAGDCGVCCCAGRWGAIDGWNRSTQVLRYTR